MAEAPAGYGSTESSDGLEAGKLQKLSLLPGNSTWLTACLIVADVVGAGILGLPVAVAKIGWLPGLVLILLLLAMNVHISCLMWRVRMYFGDDVSTYQQMVSKAFSRAGEGVQERMSSISGAIQYTFIVAMLGVYMLSAGKALGDMFYNIFLCLPTWSLIACCFIVPVHATARRLGTWKNLVWMNVAAISAACLLPLGYMYLQGIEHSRPVGSKVESVASFDFSNGFAALSTFTFGFTGQFMIIEIISEMKEPSEFPKAYVYISAPFQAAAFVLVGIGGYYFIGDKATGMIGDNVPFGTIFRITFVCLLVQMTTTYLMKGIVIARAMMRCQEKDPDQDDGLLGPSGASWIACVVSIAGFAWLIASTVPFFNDLVDLVGASVTPVACYMIPIMCYVRWVKDFNSEEYTLTTMEIIVLILEFTLSVVLLIFGTYFALMDIINHWDAYGPPFACHCEDMWNTCECSATHIGMAAECLALPKEMAIQVKEMVDANFAWLLQIGTRFG
jgi:amino acid permease